MAPLQRALALPQMAHLGAVADDLHFDVARVGEQFFGIEPRVAERRVRFGRAALERVFEFGRGGDDAHAASAAAGDRFDDHRAAAARCEKSACGIDVDRRGRAGRHRHAALRRECRAPQLVAEQFERGGVGSDERDAGIGERRGEARILGEESVTRMHRVAVVGARRGDDRGDVEIRRNAAPARVRATSSARATCSERASSGA